MSEQNWSHDTGDRQQHVQVRQEGPYVERLEVIEDLAEARNQALSKITQLIWFLFGVLEVLIGLRILLKLIGANPASAFASLVYSITDLFLWPFFGLTATPAVGAFVLEIPAIIAMIVYALIAWAMVKILWLLFYSRPTTSVTHYERDIQ